MIDQRETIVVGLGEMRVSRSPAAVLACLGLGSCVAVCAYDPVSKIGGMAHVVLPEFNGTGPSPKYANSAVPLLVQEMNKLGAPESRLVFKIAGGATISMVAGLNGAFRIGERNVEATRIALSRRGYFLKSADVGGNCGRTVRLYLDSGKVAITSARQESREI